MNNISDGLYDGLLEVWLAVIIGWVVITSVGVWAQERSHKKYFEQLKKKMRKQ